MTEEPLDFSQYIGQSAAEVERELKQLYPTFDVGCYPLDAMVTADYRTDRIRIFHDEDDFVDSVTCG